MEPVKLFMLLLGSKPQQRNTEQHDVFFSIGTGLKDLLPEIYAFWPEAQQKIHIDAWREVTQVDGYNVTVLPKGEVTTAAAGTAKLFFINLGGYKPYEFEEFHYKMLAAASDKGVAIQKSKQTAFFQHTGFENAGSHVDDKYGIDVDDMYEITDILPPAIKDKYSIVLSVATGNKTDEFNLGYTRLGKL